MSESAARLSWMLMVLTFTTGLVDAVSFIGLGHVFTANMTGNVVFIAFALAGVDELSAARSLVAIATFLLGAALGGRLALVMQGHSHRRWLGIAAGFECTVLAAAAAAAVPYDFRQATPGSSAWAVVCLTAVVMGFRNATALRLKDPDLKTTVLTLTLTSIAADSGLAGGTNPRLGRRLVSVMALFAGGVSGALVLQYLGTAAALGLMASAVALGMGLYLTHGSSAEKTL